MVKVKKSVRSTRNPELVQGVRLRGRTAGFKKTAGWKFINKGAAGKKTEKKEEEKKTTVQKEPRWYAADPVMTPLPSRKSHHKKTTLRSSLTAGTVVIILAGRFRGKRAIFLKQLPSGLILVTGPYDINGVPLRRFNQRYVIATSTKVDVKSVDVSKINDAFFAKNDSDALPKEGKFFSSEEKRNKLPANRKDEQKRVDGSILESIKKVENLKHYLKAKFSLTKGQRPHALKF